MRSRFLHVVAALGIFSTGAAFALAEDEAVERHSQQPLETKGKVTQVTVYRDQALVTREIMVPGPKGLREVVVLELPENVVSESIFAEASPGLAVRSVRYRIRPVLQDVREEVRKLDEKIRSVQDQAQAKTRYAQLAAERKAYLDKLEQFTAPTANVELTKGVLNAETLKALSTFLFGERQSLADTELSLATEQRSLNEQLALLNRERDVLTGGSAKTMREAVVFVHLDGDQGTMRLRYLVTQASWEPSYNVRTAADPKHVAVEYNASVQQMSGEDWTDVQMSLSTATPSLAAMAPILDPLQISLGPMEPGKSADGALHDYASAKRLLDDQRRQIEITRGQKALNQVANAAPGQSPTPGGELQADYDMRLNSLAGELQVLDLVSQGKVSRASKPTASPTAEGVSVNYDLAERTSLPSRADRQLIQVASLPMKADFYKVAVPVLTSYVYDEALVTNEGKLVLLPGAVTTYRDGRFVGRGELPLIAVGESFKVGFGIDSSLRAARELVTKSEAIQGGNRLVDFTYQLKIENFGSQAAQVRVMDRLPTAKESEVKLTLVSPGQPLSEDPRYLQTERKKGMLRWEVSVPEQAIAQKATTVEYKLQLEYDKQLSIAGLPVKR